MKVSLAPSGAICFDGDIDKAKITEQDDAMRQLGELLGVKIMIVKLSGCWVVRVDDHIVSGDMLKGQPRRRSLTSALCDGFQRGVSSTVPIK